MQSFKLIENEHIEEIDSVAMRYEHIKTGAKILFLKNENAYRFFNITFMTPAYNSSGTPHILEHCVLAGSKKYGLDATDRFRYSMLNGELNASTFADHTDYYCMTYNESMFTDCADFLLDSCFNPLFLEEENIFLREGWRINMTETDEGISFSLNGVVLNEMRYGDDYGNRMTEKMNKRLISESVYNHRAGGRLYKIPRCSYEEVCDYYKKYYTASNAHIFAYGNIDVDDMLKLIDSYIDKANLGEGMPIQKIINNKSLVQRKEKIHYTSEEKHMYSYACLFDGKVRPKQAFAFKQVREEIETQIEDELGRRGLYGTARCILKQNAIQDKVVIDFMCKVESAGKDVYKGIKKAFKGIYDSSEVSRAPVMGKLNREEIDFWDSLFRCKGAGKFLWRKIMPYLLYDIDNPLDAYRISSHVQYVKNRIWGNWYKTFVSEIMPKEGREVLLEFFCVDEGSNYYERRLQEELDKKIALMDENDEFTIKKKQEAFEKWTKKQAKQRIKVKNDPVLSPLPLDYSKEEKNGVTFFHIPSNNGKLSYVTLSFKADAFIEHISELKLLIKRINEGGFSSFYGLGARDTKNLLTNGINAYVSIRNAGDKSLTDRKISVTVDISFEAMEENVPDIISVIQRMLFDVYIVYEGFDRFLDRRIEKLRDAIIDNPDTYNWMCAGYDFDSVTSLEEKRDGIAYYTFLKAFKEGDEINKLQYFKNCYAMLNRIFNNDNLTVFCTSGERGFTLLKKAVFENTFENARKEFFSHLKKDYNYQIKQQCDYEKKREWKDMKEFVLHNCNNTVPEKWYEHKATDKDMPNVGVIIPSKVGFVSLYSEVKNHVIESKQTAVLCLAVVILKRLYLKNSLREIGGAYGYGARFEPIDGYLEIYSSSDPDIDNAIGEILGCASYLQNFDMDDNEFDTIKNALIENRFCLEGANHMDTEDMIINIESGRIKSFIDEEMADWVKECTKQDIRDIAGLFKELLDYGVFCAFGSEKAINALGDFFGRVERL
ncbi:MAG: insulinase family protein [Lachnospiraceae bacterium]|nr:insulinase family protein [Lachnospiraceae bacterium]